MTDIKEQWHQSVAEFELFAYDVMMYGDNAYLMWQLSNAENENDGDYYWTDCSITVDFNKLLRYRRKESAAMPFDLERAKNGDAVQVLLDEKLIDFDFKRWLISGDVGIDNINFQYPTDLRMKYPKDKEKAQLIEARKVALWFYPLCVAGYAAICYLFYLMF